MRLVIAGLALAITVPAVAGVPGMTAASASSPVSTQPLAPGEVLLEINAMGAVTTRADLATVTVLIQATAATQDAARPIADDLERRVVAAARSAGVAPADIVRQPLTEMDSLGVLGGYGSVVVVDNGVPAAGLIETSMAMSPDPLESPDSPATEQPVPQETVRRRVEIRLRNLDRLAALQDGLRGAGARDPAAVAYSLTNMGPARREARNRAIASARADAEAYARALGMRVVRIVRVTERLGTDLFSLALSESAAMRRNFGESANRGPDIDTGLAIGVDFALVPQ